MKIENIMNVYYFKEDRRNVTEMYFDVMIEALRRNGYNIIAMESCKWSITHHIPKSAYVIVTGLHSFMKLYFCGIRNYIYWYQGIEPEEDYLRHHNRWRRFIFSWLEQLSLRKCKFRIAVSKYIFQHYEKKYGIQFDKDTVFIMPCYNSQISKDNFYIKDKYEHNIFCYAGGLQVWQGFDEIVDVFAKIEKKCPDAFFKVYSKELFEARRILEAKGVKNYSVDCVSQEEMQKALSDCKFGFIIREDNIVNNVATPTKLGTYLGNGVIPILNRTVHFFNDLSNKYRYIVNIDIKDPYSAIEPYFSSMNADDIYAEYSRLFAENYDAKLNAKRLQEFFNLEKK